MSSKKVWFITGASRGMGSDIAKAALDVTSREDAEAVVRAALEKFGRIDVLVNNAASSYAGYFEELSPEQFEQQLATSLFGPINVTRARSAVMRKQRAGQVISISSAAGISPRTNSSRRTPHRSSA